MSNKERLASHYRMFSWIIDQGLKKHSWLGEEDETDWVIIENRYPELITFIEDLLSHLEDYVKREEELFDVENHILWIDYRDYKFKIYLDAERNTLVGDVLLNNEIDVIGLESDSITHLITEMERAVDNQINYKYQSELAKEIIEKNRRIKELEQRNYRLKSKTKIMKDIPEVTATLYWWTKEPDDRYVSEENIVVPLNEERLESLGLRYGSNLIKTQEQIDCLSELINEEIELDTYDYFFEYHGNF